MRIIALDNNPQTAAEHLSDQHVRHMIVRLSVALGSAFLDSLKVPDGIHEADVEDVLVWAQWARASTANYNWLSLYTKYVFWEYYFRFGERHKRQSAIMSTFGNPPPEVDPGELSPFPQTVPTNFVIPLQAVMSFRLYYFAKHKYNKWKLRGEPQWWKEMASEGKTSQYPAIMTN